MKKRKGQNIAEYSILITLIIIAAVGMQTYVKRGLSGRVKDAVDFVGPTMTGIGGVDLTLDGAQYTPYYEVSDTQVRSSADAVNTLAVSGGVAKTGIEQSAMVDSAGYEMTTAAVDQ